MNLAHAGREVKRLETEAAEIKKEAEELKGKMRSVVEKLGIKTMEQDGVKITYVAPIEYYYPQDKLKEALPESVYKRLFRPVFDPTLLEGEVMEGNVDLKLLNSLKEEKVKKPSLRITIKGE